jgi:hypothetical protein
MSRIFVGDSFPICISLNRNQSAAIQKEGTLLDLSFMILKMTHNYHSFKKPYHCILKFYRPDSLSYCKPDSSRVVKARLTIMSISRRGYS